MTKLWTLYVLRLEHEKWYVGITSQTPEKRFKEHLQGRKSYWTELHPPIELADTKSLGDLGYEDAKAYEDKVTRVYMRRKGINNVRGGSLTQTSDYIIRFGYIFDKFGWEALTIIILQFAINFALALKLYL